VNEREVNAVSSTVYIVYGMLSLERDGSNGAGQCGAGGTSTESARGYIGAGGGWGVASIGLDGREAAKKVVLRW